MEKCLLIPWIQGHVQQWRCAKNRSMFRLRSEQNKNLGHSQNKLPFLLPYVPQPQPSLVNKDPFQSDKQQLFSHTCINRWKLHQRRTLSRKVRSGPRVINQHRVPSPAPPHRVPSPDRGRYPYKHPHVPSDVSYHSILLSHSTSNWGEEGRKERK